MKMKTYEQLLKENRAYERMFMNIESAILDFRRSQLNIQEETEDYAKVIQSSPKEEVTTVKPVTPDSVLTQAGPIAYVKEVTVVDEAPAKPRRGRKPGSKNKPKAPEVPIMDKISQAVAEVGGTMFTKFKEVSLNNLGKDNKDNSVYVQSKVEQPDLVEKQAQFIKRNINGTLVNVIKKG